MRLTDGKLTKEVFKWRPLHERPKKIVGLCSKANRSYIDIYVRPETNNDGRILIRSMLKLASED